MSFWRGVNAVKTKGEGGWGKVRKWEFDPPSWERIPSRGHEPAQRRAEKRREPTQQGRLLSAKASLQTCQAERDLAAPAKGGGPFKGKGAKKILWKTKLESGNTENEVSRSKSWKKPIWVREESKTIIGEERREKKGAWELVSELSWGTKNECKKEGGLEGGRRKQVQKEKKKVPKNIFQFLKTDLWGEKAPATATSCARNERPKNKYLPGKKEA